MDDMWSLFYPQPEVKRHSLDYDALIKILLIGDSSVGKSCMLTRFTESLFNTNHMITVGVDFKVKMIELRGIRIKVQIWDTAGQERYKSITQAYYRSADGVLLVFDTTNRSTFDSIPSWVQQIRYNAPDDVCMVLVGNKADLVGQQQVQKQEVDAYAKEMGVEYIETSAKTGQNINAAFHHCLGQVIDIQFPTLSSAVSDLYNSDVPASTKGGSEDAVAVRREYMRRYDARSLRRKIRLRRERQLEDRMREEADDCCSI